MKVIEQAYHEIDQLQEIISRHEGHMFALRGWLLVVIGGLLAAYYTVNIDLRISVLWFALGAITLLFLFVELQHVNMIESLVERVGVVEKIILDNRSSNNESNQDWYDGPKVNEVCRIGANRLLPRNKMTFKLNLPFYIAVIIIVLFTTVLLPSKQPASPSPVTSTNSTVR